MKILIVRTHPSVMNFNQYNVQEIGLAKALVRKGYECGIVFYNGKNRDEVDIEKVDCEDEIRQIIIYKLHGYNVFKNGFYPSLNKISKEYDIIQVHEYDQITSWMYYAWSKKTVIVYHGPYYHEFNKGYNFRCKIFDKTFLRIRNNENVLCMTKSELAAEFLRRKGFNNVKVVGVGLDTDKFKSECEETAKIPIDRSKKNVIYVGKLEKRRNGQFLLQVMSELCKRNSDVRCIIVGDGKNKYVKDFLKRANIMLDAKNFQYYRSLSQRQLAWLYRESDLMIFPSTYEIFGMVLLEAVYFRLPVITTKNGGSDIVATNELRGLIINGFDLNEWVCSAERIVKSARFKIENNYVCDEDVSWDLVSEKIVECYKMVY